jgi:hypothetical protein
MALAPAPSGVTSDEGDQGVCWQVVCFFRDCCYNFGTDRSELRAIADGSIMRATVRYILWLHLS